MEGRKDVMTVILISVEEDNYQCSTSELEDDEIIYLFHIILCWIHQWFI